MFTRLITPFVVLARWVRDFADYHPAIYTFNPARDTFAKPHMSAELRGLDAGR